MIEPSQIQVPGAAAEGTATTLSIRAPAIGGPAGNMRYELQVAEDRAFNNITVSLSGSLRGNSVTIDVGSLCVATGQVGGPSATAQARSLQAARGLRGNTKCHWRARIRADGRERTVVCQGNLQDTFKPQRPHCAIAGQTNRGGDDVGPPIDAGER